MHVRYADLDRDAYYVEALLMQSDQESITVEPQIRFLVVAHKGILLMVIGKIISKIKGDWAMGRSSL